MNRIQFGPIDLYGCQDALVRLDDFIDHQLSPLETKKVRTHLRICRHCIAKFNFEDELVRGLRQKVVSVDVPDALKSRLHSAMEQARLSGEDGLGSN